MNQDAKPARRIGDGLLATATEQPSSLEALRETIARHGDAGSALFPQGGCTALDYGGVPRRSGVAIDLTALDTVIDYPAADMTITVEAGITLGRLQEILAQSGQRLPLDPPDAAHATLGGIFATDSAGPRRFGCGRPRDMIIGVSFVTSDGALVKGGGRVVKNVAGYDFPKLLTGSMGTLGVITQLTLKVRPIPESRAIVLAGYPRLEGACRAVERLNTSKTRPVAIELLNAPAARALTDSTDDWTIFVGFEGNRQSVDWQIDAVHAELDAASFAAHRDAESDEVWRALADFRGRKSHRLSMQVASRPSALPSILDCFDQASYMVQCHAGSGVTFASWIGTDDHAAAQGAFQSVRTIAEGLGASVTLPHCPADWKSALGVWGTRRPDWAWMERIKRALDPQGALNPGRFIGDI